MTLHPIPSEFLIYEGEKILSVKGKSGLYKHRIWSGLIYQWTLAKW
jgi:hypothetical protein